MKKGGGGEGAWGDNYICSVGHDTTFRQNAIADADVAGTNTLHNWISRCFYSIGLFCASHPFVVFFISFVVWTTCSLPLFLFGLGELQPRLIAWPASSTPTSMETQLPALAEVSIFSIRLDVPESATTDVNACRHIMLTAMDTLERVENFHTVIGTRNVSLQDFCYKGANEGKRCVLSTPGMFWQNEKLILLADPDPLQTITKNTSLYREAIIGGLKHSWGSDRVMSFSSLTTTFALETSADGEPERTQLISDLQQWLRNSGPELGISVEWKFPRKGTTHLYFEVPQIELSSDVIFLVCTYILVALYIYFSVETKFHMVKSKVGLGFTAVAMLLISLSMSVGICTAFGFVPTLVVVEVIPFLIIAVGVENIFFITHAVVATPLDNEVRHRVAEGMAHTGVSIVLYLWAELFITVVGSFSAIDALSEFCIFAFFSLLVDFYLQIIFFPAVLSIDIRRMELSDIQLHLKHCTTAHKPPKRTSKFFTRWPSKLISALVMMILLAAAVVISESEGVDVVQPPYNTNTLLHVHNAIRLDRRFVSYIPPISGVVQEVRGSAGEKIDLTSIQVHTDVSAINITLTFFSALENTANGMVGEISSHTWANMVLIASLFLIVMACVWHMTSGLHERIRGPGDIASQWGENDIDIDEFDDGTELHHADITQLVSSEQIVLSSFVDSVVKVWDIETGQCLKIYKFAPNETCSESQRDAVWSIAGGRNGLVVVGLASGCIVVDRVYPHLNFGGNKPLDSVLTPTQMRMPHCDSDKPEMGDTPQTVILDDLVKTSAKNLAGISCITTSVYHIVTGDFDGCVKVWASFGSNSSTSRVSSSPFTEPIVLKNSSSTQSKFSSGYPTPLGIIGELGTIQSTLSIICHKSTVSALEVNNSFCVSASADSTICIISLVEGVILRTIEARGQAISSVSLSGWTNTSRATFRVVSGDEDGHVHIWDARTGSRVGELEGLSSSVVGLGVEKGHSFAPGAESNRILTWGCDFERIIVWESSTGRICCTIPILDRGQMYPAHLENELIAVGGLDSVEIYDAMSGACVRVIDLPKLRVSFDRRSCMRPDNANSETTSTTTISSLPVSVRLFRNSIICARAGSLFRLTRKDREKKTE
eukprot:CFRG5447T1